MTEDDERHESLRIRFKRYFHNWNLLVGLRYKYAHRVDLNKI